VFQVADLTAAFAFQYDVTLKSGKETRIDEKSDEAFEMTPAFAFSGKVTKLAENC
jgi:hypothetical protein